MKTRKALSCNNKIGYKDIITYRYLILLIKLYLKDFAFFEVPFNINGFIVRIPRKKL